MPTDPVIGQPFEVGEPIEDPPGTSWDMAFELTTEECMMPSHPDYANWLYWGYPKCWCYKYQCRGDFNGTAEGPFYISLADLVEYRKWVGKFEGPPFPPPYLTQEGICADFVHEKEGPFWVSLNDMIIYRLWVGKFEGPPFPPPYLQPCDNTYINFWTSP